MSDDGMLSKERIDHIVGYIKNSDYVNSNKFYPRLLITMGLEDIADVIQIFRENHDYEKADNLRDRIKTIGCDTFNHDGVTLVMKHGIIGRSIKMGKA